MKLQVLGPVAASVDGEPLTLGGIKQRTVLAVLLARRPRPVSADALAEAVWGDELPDRARRRVQTYVSTLRSIVGDVVEKQGDGWSLTVAADDIDAARFEHLYQSSIGQEPEAAAELLGQALSLWRGPPYAEVEANGELDAEVTRLIQLRATVLHARIEADLDRGRHAELIGELESLIGEHPYHEQFRAQHVLALYRSGRQRDALRSFAELRERLVDELGVDPSPELQELERRILDHDADLLARQPTAPARPAEVATGAAAFPNPLSSLVGREVELERIIALLDMNQLVTMTGLGGCGKTRLAIETGRRLSDEFADGVHFVDLRATVRDDEVASAVAGALGVGAGGGDPLVRVGEYLADKHLLVVLDNCEHLLDGCAAFVDTVLPASTGVRLLATSREALYIDGEQLYAVPPLPSDGDHSIELFRARAVALDPDFVVDDTNRDTLRELCGRLDHMPLAIELAASRTTVMSPSELLSRIDDRFNVLAGGRQRRRNRTRTLEATLEWSYDLLDASEQKLFCDLGVFADAIGPDEAAAIAEVPVAEVIDLVDSLVAKSLVVATRTDEATRLRLLETVQAYATAKSAEAGRLEGARDRHLRHYVEASLRNDDVGQFASANIDAAIDWAIATERWADAAHILCAEGRMWQQSDYFPEWGNLRNARSKLDRLDLVASMLEPGSELSEWLTVAELNLALADYDEARVLDAGRRASHAHTTDVKVWGLHVTALFTTMVDRDEALRAIEQASQINDMDEPQIIARSYIHMFDGEYEEALAGFQSFDRGRARWHDATAAALLLILDRPAEAFELVDGHPATGTCWNAYRLISGLALLALGQRGEAEAELLGAARQTVDGKVPYVANTSLVGLAALLADDGDHAWASEILLGAASQRLGCVYALARMVGAQAGVLDAVIEAQGPHVIAKNDDATMLLRSTLERWDERTT